jgi:hypothetical protein
MSNGERMMNWILSSNGILTWMDFVIHHHAAIGRCIISSYVFHHFRHHAFHHFLGYSFIEAAL